MGKLKFVEGAFSTNDWFLLGMLVLSFGIYFVLPKKIRRSTRVLLIMFSVALAVIFDSAIGYRPFDHYDIMDGPAYTVMDLLVYVAYAPFAYFFIHIYRLLEVRAFGAVVYVAVASAFGVGFEMLCHRLGIFTYKSGYNIHYSYTIYLFVQSVTLWFYHFIEKNPTTDGGQPS